MKLQSAKLELNVFLLLEKTNKEFSDKWKNYPQKTNEQSFQDCIQNYQTIRELIEYNRKKNVSSNLLESYYLEAWLGEIQSQLNSLPQNPHNEDIVLSNDEKIEELTKSLLSLKTNAETLNLHGQKKIDKALLKDFQDLFDKISEYSSYWDKTIYERKAAYYYNVAENLIKESDELSTNDQDFDLKKNLLSTSIDCIKAARNFYELYEQYQYANETLQYQKQIEKQFKQLIESPKSVLKISPTKPLTETSTYSKEKLSKNSLESHNRDEPTSAPTFSAKKRVHWKNSYNSEEPPQKQFKKPIIKSPNEEKIFETSCSSSSINQEELITRREQEFKDALNKISSDNPFRIYGQLFFKLSKKLSIYSKESSNHTLLTQLSWLTLSQQLLDLIGNKNQQDYENSNEIKAIKEKLLEKNKKNLNVISQQKRNEAYPTYTLSNLQSLKLQTLLLDEVFDYYYGLEAFKQTSAAKSFLDSTSEVIKNNNFNPLEEIKKAIQSAHKLNESLFYAKLLRELIKFHVCPKNANWQKTTFSSDSRLNLNKEYVKILTIAENFTEQSNNESQDLKNKIKLLKNHLLQQFQPNSIPTGLSHSSFFKSVQQTSSIELLINLLQEHFQCLLKYKNPGIHSDDIYKHLVKFIHTHCLEQIQLNHAWTSKLSNTILTH